MSGLYFGVPFRGELVRRWRKEDGSVWVSVALESPIVVNGVTRDYITMREC